MGEKREDELERNRESWRIRWNASVKGKRECERREVTHQAMTSDGEGRLDLFIRRRTMLISDWI